MFGYLIKFFNLYLKKVQTYNDRLKFCDRKLKRLRISDLISIGIKNNNKIKS